MLGTIKQNRVEMKGTERRRIEWKCQVQGEVEQSGNVRNNGKQNRVEMLGTERRRGSI